MDLRERGKALEDAFYAKKNKELLLQLRQELETGDQHEDLRAATGLTDIALLHRLLDLEVTAEAIAAMSMAPMVLVAWADGKLDGKERDAIIQAAEEHGIGPESVAGQILQSWLNEQPGDDLKEVWLDYTRALCETLSAGDQVKLADNMMGRCKQVAEAAGGFLGLGSISRVELDMIAELSAAFG